MFLFFNDLTMMLNSSNHFSFRQDMNNRSWIVLAISSLIASTSATDPADYRSSKYPAHHYVQRINCMDEGFDLNGYLTTERGDLDDRMPPKVRFYFEKWFNKAFTGHTFPAIGQGPKGWGESCLDDIDAAGCRPFRNVITKFQNLDTCLAGVAADGSWMNTKPSVREFNRYHYKDSRRIITRLAKLATGSTGDDEWKSQDKLHNMVAFQEATVVIDRCVEQNINREELKCLPVLLGAPGYVGLTVLEHNEHQHEKNDRHLSHNCRVPPACGRLAIERLYHYQNMYFDNSFVLGGLRSKRLNKGKTWAVVDDELRNYGCEIDPKAYGQVVCWHHAKCTRLMMQQLCQEHEQCCPSTLVHEACRAGLRNKHCKVCDHE